MSTRKGLIYVLYVLRLLLDVSVNTLLVVKFVLRFVPRVVPGFVPRVVLVAVLALGSSCFVACSSSNMSSGGSIYKSQYSSAGEDSDPLVLGSEPDAEMIDQKSRASSASYGSDHFTFRKMQTTGHPNQDIFYFKHCSLNDRENLFSKTSYDCSER